MICHFLIGVPGSGKSTFAAELAKLGNYRIVSTDTIRQQLYGDASIQGDWLAIEEKVIAEIVEALAPLTEGIAQSYGVIYDATNAKRMWRMLFLMKLKALTPAAVWMAWYLRTPIAICKLHNQQRDRQVPQVIIESMYKSLQDFPPIAAEGFAAVKEINITSPSFDFQEIYHHIEQLPHSIINRANRDRHITLHPYSELVDFERLMHLISLIIRYPGIGNLQATQPSQLESIFGKLPEFASSLEEVSACMGKLCGSVYADAQAIASDLHWLQKNNFIGDLSVVSSQRCSEIAEVLSVVHPSVSPSPPHPYSDLATFQRLMQTIRWIVHHPVVPDSGEESLKTLISALKENGIIDGDNLDHLRNDIENVLKPYKIFPNLPVQDGDFGETNILHVYGD
ncbi:ATP-binding protein [Tolypothrix sp. FACHB-123]|uniref:ATP-binding protein n=1 Tax=Tolypothrix sp. FACHB-123 TaxID=2692868 RepID=UPI001681D2FD|nr:ATP-binding protein [Tolypothrix sp. FACHB-123]MBD2356494.1 ATP-binding protein [Tolypothrix sp. FACHB-123]